MLNRPPWTLFSFPLRFGSSLCCLDPQSIIWSLSMFSGTTSHPWGFLTWFSPLFIWAWLILCWELNLYYLVWCFVPKIGCIEILSYAILSLEIRWVIIAEIKSDKKWESFTKKVSTFRTLYDSVSFKLNYFSFTCWNPLKIPCSRIW